MYIKNWKSIPSGGAITIDGFAMDGRRVKLRRVRVIVIESKTRLGGFLPSRHRLVARGEHGEYMATLATGGDV